VLAQVVDVHSQQHGGTFGGSDRCDHIHQLGFAVEATIGVVQPVRRTLHLLRDHRCPAQAPLVGEGTAVHLFVAGERGGDGRDGMNRIGPQRAVRDCGKERRVGATAERDDHATEPEQFQVQCGQLAVEIHAAHPTDGTRGADRRGRPWTPTVGAAR